MCSVRPDENVKVAGEAPSPMKATACLPTMRKSTLSAFNEKQRSAKSFWISIPPRSSQGGHVLSSQALHFADPVFVGRAPLVNERGIIRLFFAKRSKADHPFHIDINQRPLQKYFSVKCFR